MFSMFMIFGYLHYYYYTIKCCTTIIITFIIIIKDISTDDGWR